MLTFIRCEINVDQLGLLQIACKIFGVEKGSEGVSRIPHPTLPEIHPAGKQIAVIHGHLSVYDDHGYTGIMRFSEYGIPDRSEFYSKSEGMSLKNVLTLLIFEKK